MPKRFNPPPNWPAPPEGWVPPMGWKPDPSWGPPPKGWKVFVDDAGEGDHRSLLRRISDASKPLPRDDEAASDRTVAGEVVRWVAPVEAPWDPDAIWQSVGKPVTGIGAGRYKLTAHYLFFERGVVSTDAQQVPIAGVLDVDVRQSMVQKARGVGTIRLHVQRTQGVEIVHLEDVPDFREGQRHINETAHAARLAIQRNQNTMRYEGQHPLAAVGTAQPTSDPLAQLEQLAKMRDAGFLTDEEFTAKKAQILARM